jgi:DNA-binding SARP family transcriptional activator
MLCGVSVAGVRARALRMPSLQVKMVRLTIRLLGPLEIALSGKSVTGFDSEKVRALLAYLAAEAGRPHRREVLAEMLWPGRAEGAARANLRHALAQLRQAIGDHAASPPYLLPSRHAIQFNDASDAWIDVAAFSALLPIRRVAGLPTEPQAVLQLEEAVRLWRGPFLEDLSLADSAAFEEWRVLRREHLQRLMLDALWRLVESYEGRGEHERALAYARRELELEPWDEAGQRQVMRLLALTGRHAEALAQYGAFRRVLADEFGVEPPAETTRLYEQIRRGALEPSAGTPVALGESVPALQVPSFLEKDACEAERPVFVARERELAFLHAHLAEVLAGHGRVVFVTGGPGQGKTALLTAFARQAMEAHPDLLAAAGKCSAYAGTGDPYLPFREVMAMLTGDVEAAWLSGAITIQQARRLWSSLPQVIQALLQHGPHTVGTLVPAPSLLARAALWRSIEAAAPSGVSWLQQLSEQVERRTMGPLGPEASHLFQQVTHVLWDLARVHPLVLILDDLQWADTASIGLLFHLGRRLEGARILIAGAYRAEEVALGRGGGRHPLEAVLSELKRTYGDVWLDLAAVNEREQRHFVDSLLGTEPNCLGTAFRNKLATRTGGHPLFAVELLRAMQGRGDLIRDGTGRWVEGAALNWSTLPARVEGVIEERIGRLEPELRQLLSVASVEGEEFTLQVVAHAQGLPEREVRHALSHELQGRHRLVREQGVVPAGSGRLSRYRFSHALFQQYLYRELGEGERTAAHGQIAAALESLYAGDTAPVAGQLAHHYANAGDDRRALTYYALAGDVALASYGNPEAEAHYRRALGLGPGEAQRAKLLSGLGQALYRQTRLQEAIQSWQEGLGLYRELGDTGGMAQLYAHLVRATNQAAGAPAGLRLCQEGLAALSGAPESAGLADLLRETAVAYVGNKMMDQALPICQQALEMAGRLGAVGVQAAALASLGHCGLPPEESREALLKAVALAEEAGLLEVAARAQNSLGVDYAYILADPRTAREYSRRSAELYGRAGAIANQVYVLANVSQDSQYLGEFEEAEATHSLIHQLLGQLEEPGSATENAFYAEIWLLLHRGEWAEAARLALARRSAARQRQSTFLGVDGYLLGWAALESCELGGDVPAADLDEAEAALGEAIGIVDHLPYYLYRVEARTVLGAIYVCQGRLQDACRMLEDTRQVARLQPTGWDEQSLLWLEARLARAKECWPEALSAFEALVGVYQRLGWRWRWARALLAWADVCLARGEPGDRQRAAELLRESQGMFEAMGISRLADLAARRLESLANGRLRS